MQTDRTLLRASFFLFLTALFTGLLIPVFRIPRLGLSAHLTALMNSFVLITLLVVWPRLAETPRARLIRNLFLFSAFTMSFGGILGAAWGTSWFTPMASAGFRAPFWQEALIGLLVMTTVLVYIVASSMVVWSLRPRRHADSEAEAH